MKKFLFKSALFLCALLLFTEGQRATAANSPDSLGYLVKVGDACPEFEIVMADGKKTSLKDLKGKVVMLQFTASWCSVCRKEMPFIESEIWREYKDKGLVVIGIDRDEPLDKVQKFAADMNITYPLALDPGANVFALFAEKESGVTRNVILNRDGTIIFCTRLFRRPEFEEMKSKIAEELSKTK